MKKNNFFNKKKYKTLNEGVYSLSAVNIIHNKKFSEILLENQGEPFDLQEKKKFIEKQEGFAGEGKVEFLFKAKANEISTQIFSNNTTKIYVFKKLKNEKHKGLLNYVCFVYVQEPNNNTPQKINEKSSTNVKCSNYKKYMLFVEDLEKTKTYKENTRNKSNKTSIQYDIIYLLSTSFKDDDYMKKIEILSDFITQVSDYSV